MLLHAAAADADEACIRIVAAQGEDEIGAELVAGVFAGDEGNDEALIIGGHGVLQSKSPCLM